MSWIFFFHCKASQCQSRVESRRGAYPHLPAIIIGPEFGLEHLVHQLLCFLLGVFLANASQN